MPIHYTVVSKRPAGMAGQNSPKYYPSISGRKKIEIEELREMISKRSTAHPADVIAVLGTLVDLLPELLLNGHSVKLGELGLFALHASANGKESPEQVNAKDIKSLKMSFRPSNKIKKRLEGAQFRKMR